MFNFNPVSMRLSPVEQTGERHAIANAWIKRRKHRSECETASKALRFRRWKREKAKFRFTVRTHGRPLFRWCA